MGKRSNFHFFDEFFEGGDLEFGYFSAELGEDGDGVFGFRGLEEFEDVAGGL